MKLILDIPNNQADFFMQLIRSLNFDMRIEKEETDTDTDIPKWHKAILDERMDKLRTPDTAFYSWKDVKKLTTQRKVTL
jgi:hypothetical protein